MPPTWLERAGRAFLSNYYPARITLVRGEGCLVFDDRGREYLDFLGGIAVNSLGHCHPSVVEAVRKQSATLMHISNLYQHPVQIELAERLVERFPGGRVFFCNSGAEANEAAMKLARRHAHQTFGPGRHFIVSALNSFHGRTAGALAATGQTQYHQGFEPLLPGIRHVPFGEMEPLKAAVGEDTCAVLLEPIQGEGGVVVPPRGYFANVAKLCRERNVLLMLDEVQTGMGRTGTLFAHQAEEIVPDVITLSKSLGAGLPLGALLARGDCASAFQPGTHASTFGGNPVACAAALALLEIVLEEGFLARVESLGTYFRKGLEGIVERRRAAVSARGRGLLLALELSVAAKPVVEEALSRGYLINAVRERVLRFAPPFIIEEDQITGLLGDLEEILAESD